MPKAEIDKRTARAAAILQLEPLLERKPSQLSGGQRQRVAIGRAIVREPQVFLFDEPLSNLDAALRVQMRVEITKLHQDLGATMIYVTHDQVEAMTMADKIVVLRPARSSRSARRSSSITGRTTSSSPASSARPKMNFLKTTASPAATARSTSRCPAAARSRWTPGSTRFSGRQPVTLGVRPEHLGASASLRTQRSTARSGSRNISVRKRCFI